MEYLRRILRRLLGANSSLYGAGAATLDFAATVRRESVSTWRALKALQAAPSSPDASQAVRLRSLKHPIFIRPGTLDAGTVLSNAIREEYGHFEPDTEPAWMIDAGAYIGDTAAYFLSRFPALKVIALEPNPENVAMAERNLHPYGDRALLLRKGLYAREGEIRFSGSGTAGSISSEGFTIDCTTLPALIRRYSIPRIDILKMDIEGGEEALFQTEPESWLGRVDWLIIEIHSEKIREQVARVLAANGFSMRRYRSVWYCRNNKGG